MWVRRRYLLITGLALTALVVPIAGVRTVATYAEGSSPGGVAGGTNSHTTLPGNQPERVTTLRLGDFRAPASGARVMPGLPAGAPLVGGTRTTDRRGAAPRTLLLSRPSTARFSAVGVTWRATEPTNGCRRTRTGSVHCSVHSHSTDGNSHSTDEHSHSTDGEARVSVWTRVRKEKEAAWSRWRASEAAEHGLAGSDHTDAGDDDDSDDDDEDDDDEDDFDGRTSEGASGHAGMARDTGASGGAPRQSRDGAELQWWGPSGGVEVAIGVLSGSPPADISVDLIDPGARAEDVGAAAESRAGGGIGPYLRQRVSMPPIIRRSGWGADESKMGWTPEYLPYVKAGTVHHTATGSDYTAVQVPAILRSIYHFHAVSRGWGDIGYNLIVDRFGRLWEGRAGGLSKAVIGAHSGGYNSYTAGLAFIGDYRTRSVPAAAVNAAARYFAWKFSLSPAFDPRGRTTLTGGGSTSRYPPGTTVLVDRIHGHRRTNPTDCPGARGMAVLGQLRERINRLMGVWTRPTVLRARLSVWRPATASWYVRGAGVVGPVLRATRGEVPVPADYDGDGTTDLATYQPATGRWTIRYSLVRRSAPGQLGAPGHIPLAADTDGDGRAEPMTWNPRNQVWYRAGLPPVRVGVSADDVPVPADYTGDGRADLAVWSPDTGRWHIHGAAPVDLGESRHVPVPADYNGDGRVDPATWSPSSAQFHIHGQPVRMFGPSGGIPLPGQYDGDTAAELAVWKAGRWTIEGFGTVRYGARGDRPVPVS